MTPIVLLPRKFYATPNHLHRLIQTRKMKRGAEYWVTLDGVLPGGAVRRHIDIATQQPTDTFDIRTIGRVGQGVKEQPLLHW
jgi:hypothetical protein